MKITRKELRSIINESVSKLAQFKPGVKPQFEGRTGGRFGPGEPQFEGRTKSYAEVESLVYELVPDEMLRMLKRSDEMGNLDSGIGEAVGEITKRAAMDPYYRKQFKGVDVLDLIDVIKGMHQADAMSYDDGYDDDYL
jgi:hypothetical protein